MPKSKSKRKKHSGRGWNRSAVRYHPRKLLRLMPVWDEDLRFLDIDLESHYRILRDGEACYDELETAACTLAARFELGALLTKDDFIKKGLRECIGILLDVLAVYKKGGKPDPEIWPDISDAMDETFRIEATAPRAELLQACHDVVGRVSGRLSS